MDDPRSRSGTILGDYRLDLLLDESVNTLTWLAEQISVQRPVLLVELKPIGLAQRESFLADVRARAAVNEPAVGSVYEAVSTEDACYVAVERLPGSTLADRVAAREGLTPTTMAAVLMRVADIMVNLETAGVETLPLTPAEIHLDGHGVVRLTNIARAGARAPQSSARDVAALGASFRPLLSDGLPGASRLNTLLAWMRGEGLDRILSWQEVRDYAVQIEQQLTPGALPPRPAAAVATETPAQRKKRKKTMAAIGGTLGLALAIAVVILATHQEKEPPAPALPGPVSVSAGAHPLPDGGEEPLPAFDIAGHEATIREYREFLDQLQTLPAAMQASFDDPAQPKTKTDHLPTGWQAMLSAARAGGMWEGRTMSLDCPVVNVDWWDAAAYCRWRANLRLPTQEEWYAALRTSLDDPAKLVPSGWSRVDQIPASDRTPAGLYGMAGSVAEWTRDPVTNPANPLGEKSYVLMGASFQRPSGRALAREWTQDLSLRRTDLGFRVVIQER